MHPDKIMIIRHAEKPIPKLVEGVRKRGEADERSLSVRGWQRAGALIAFFKSPTAPGIATPQHLLANAHDRADPDGSRRPKQTITPLAHALGLSVDTRLSKTQAQQLAERVWALQGVVLISWSHEAIPALVRAIAPDTATPEQWDDNCFDRVWVFDPVVSKGRAKGPMKEQVQWTFSQVPQRLLAGDEADITD